MQFVRDAHDGLFRVWELGVSFLGRLCCQYFRPKRSDCAGPVYFDLEIICSTIFDSSLRNWEWHKGKKHRHPHLNLLLPKPVDGERPAHTQEKDCRADEFRAHGLRAARPEGRSQRQLRKLSRAGRVRSTQATSILFKNIAPDNLTGYTIGKL